MQSTHENIYQPKASVIKEVIEENSQIKTFVLAFKDKKENEKFSYMPGQFMMVSIPHCGEAPISFSSSPTRTGTIHLSVRKAGKLTGAMHELGPGAIIGLRGPYGNSFPMEELQGKDLLFVAGGIGLAPLRSVINYCLDHKNDYGTVTILYGSRSPSDIAFKDDIAVWKKHKKATCLLTVDEGDKKWRGIVGVVTTLLDQIKPDIANTVSLVCGPPIMIRFVLASLKRMGFKDKDIITTMERHMKCGVGVCGHCHMDNKLICVDGPVFSREALKNMEVMELQA